MSDEMDQSGDGFCGRCGSRIRHCTCDEDHVEIEIDGDGAEDMSTRAQEDFKVSVSRKLVADLLEHFGPDPVTRAWCAEAVNNKGRWLFCEVKCESKEPTGNNIRRHVLTDEKIVEGLCAASQQHNGDYAWVVGDLLQEDKHDAAVADIFVQLCIFGEEKYA